MDNLATGRWLDRYQTEDSSLHRAALSVPWDCTQHGWSVWGIHDPGWGQRAHQWGVLIPVLHMEAEGVYSSSSSSSSSVERFLSLALKL